MAKKILKYKIVVPGRKGWREAVVYRKTFRAAMRAARGFATASRTRVCVYKKAARSGGWLRPLCIKD
jgi:hypothetical protein